MTIDRAIEILDPEHREHYDGIDEVNEACRMGMEALERTRWIPCSERLPEEVQGMSYDLRIAVKVDGCDKFAEIAEPEYSSPTYNLGKIFRACTGWDYKQGEYYKCSDVIGNIEKGVKELRANKAQYKQYEPENGWGTVASAVVALENLRDCIYAQAEEIPLECLYVAW